MKSNKKLSPIITELFLRGKNLIVSFVFISQTYFKMPKTIRLTQYIILSLPNKRELKPIPSNYSSDCEFKDFMKLYKYYTKEPYSFILVIDTTLP